MHDCNTPQKPPQVDVSAYRGQWVAVHRETYEVVGHGASPEEAMKPTSSSVEQPLLLFVPRSDAFLVGSSA